MYIDEFQAFMNVSVGFERILAEARKYNLVLAGLATPNNQSDTAEDRQLPFRDIAPALEFVCWIAVALAPLLRWINGPAVTSDQFVIQLPWQLHQPCPCGPTIGGLPVTSADCHVDLCTFANDSAKRTTVRKMFAVCGSSGYIQQWFVQAPVEIQLRDGKVKDAFRELPSIAQIP